MTIDLLEGRYNRVYVLAASADGDQKATFKAGTQTAELNVEDWGGFVGQWDDRVWSSGDTSHDNYGEMVGLKPGLIKRADLAWYCSHHHDASGKNVPYAYSYLFGYGIDLPAGTKTLKLPDNSRIRILAISVAEENPEVKPVQPLYDVLPSPNAGAPDFTISTSARGSVSQGKSATSRILIMPRGSFESKTNLTVSGLPEGVTARFDPSSTTGSSVMTLTASSSAAPATATVTITGTAVNLSHETTTTLSVTPILTGTVPVDLSSAYNMTGIYRDGSKFDPSASLDDGGYSFSAEGLGTEQVGAEVIFKIGPANAPDAVTSKTVKLPEGKFLSLRLLATAVEGTQEMQTFTVNYTDGTSSSFTQSMSDWAGSSDLKGESVAVQMPYRVTGDGEKDGNPFNAFAYSFSLDNSKTVKSVSLPRNRNVVVLAMTLVPEGK